MSDSHHIPIGTIKRIHVNQHHIKHNRELEVLGGSGEFKPVLTVKTSKGNFKGNEVEVDGPSRIVYQPDEPLDCGAKVWIETHAEVTVR